MTFTAEQIVESLDRHFLVCPSIDGRQFRSHEALLYCPECLPPVAVVTVAEREPVPA